MQSTARAEKTGVTRLRSVEADAVQLACRPALDPRDIDRAVARMKRDLALRGMRRRLLREKLDARSALALADACVNLQFEGDSAELEELLDK